MPNTNLGKKFDSHKLDWTLLPIKAVEKVVKVLEFGARKYDRDNWQKVARPRYVAAAWRHLAALTGGELKDPESGQHHAAHLACCCLFIIWIDLETSK